MGRKVTDGLAIDLQAPASTEIDEGELYRVDNWSHFAVTTVEADDTNRLYAGEVSQAIFACLVPVGTCGTRGGFAGWPTGAGFKKASTDLVDVAESSDFGAPPKAAIVKVETVRNSRGYARLRLVQQ